MLLPHGMPSNEQNIDLAQAARRAGWNVLTLHYRGSWGTPRVFSFGNCFEDARCAVDWLNTVDAEQNSHIDRCRLVAAGHSISGCIAAQVTAERQQIAALASLARQWR